MFSLAYIQKTVRSAELCALLLSFSLGLGPVGMMASPAVAQDQQAPSTSQNPNQQEAPPDAGGPNGNTGPYAIPKKAEEPPPPPPEKPKVEGLPDYSISVQVPLVTVPVMVTTKDGQFISNLKEDNFRVFEDGQQQTISDFKIEEAPITAVMLIEFGDTGWYSIYQQELMSAYVFANTLKKDDWVAAISYDLKPEIVVDFTQDKNALMQGLNGLRIPGFSDTNLFDALYDTVDRLERIDGHKYIILISSGLDTFSRIRYDEVLKKIKDSHDITIFSISVGWPVREYCETHGCTKYSHGMASATQWLSQIDWLQADNQMQTFAKLTGGAFYQPRFEGDIGDVFKDIGDDIRHQYMIAYRPTNAKLDGTYRKLKVEVVAPDGKPLKIQDQRHKDVKYEVIAREGYTAKHQVE